MFLFFLQPYLALFNDSGGRRCPSEIGFHLPRPLSRGDKAACFVSSTLFLKAAAISFTETVCTWQQAAFAS